MSKMKHILRKLHIGGSGGGPAAAESIDRQHDRVHPPADTMPNLSPIVAANPPISSSPASSSPPSSVSSRGAVSDAGSGSRLDPAGAAAAGPSGGGSDFSLFEEEYQVQLALALSSSDPDGVEDLDSVQMKAAKRMSLVSSAAAEAGVRSGSGEENMMEFLSLRYWSYNLVNYNEKLMDGFYDVYGVVSNPASHGKMPSLVDLQAIPVSDNIDYEVVLINHNIDHALQQLESRVATIASECKAAEHGPISSGLVQKIADLVVDKMGGPVGDAEDMLRLWTFKSYELRTSLNTIVLPLGLLEVGLSRHRALLFKVLADRVNLPCKLVKGSNYTGTDEGAVNLIKVGYDSEYIVDLMGAPGTLIPAEVPSTHLQNSGPSPRNNADTIDQSVKDLCLALDNVNSQFEKKSQMSEGSSSGNNSVSGIACLQSEEKSRAGPSTVGDNMRNSGKDHTENSGNKMFLHPPDRPKADTSGSADVISPAQQMKVHDVSKYVVTAAKNPEFAQKLHAVLLESGASPPLDLFSDLNLTQDSVEQQDAGVICMEGRAGQRDDQLPSKKAESSNSADDKRKQHCFENRSELVHKAGVPEISPIDSSGEGTYFIQGTTVASKADCQNQIYVPSAPYEDDSIPKQFNAKDHLMKLTGTDENDQQRSWRADNDRISSLLGGVAEWEIPWEDLQIGERIGLGSYGEVYRADWNGTEVAVKKFLDQGLSGDALEQFRCEVKIMLRLRHPNVVLFMGAVTRPPNLSILTEFLPRGSLYRLLHRPNVKLDEKRRLKMALDVARGMNYLHTSHPTIVHRDLKSPNLLVDKNWVVKNPDFTDSAQHHVLIRGCTPSSINLDFKVILGVPGEFLNLYPRAFALMSNLHKFWISSLVCDFGLSRLKHHTFLSSKSTAGTPEWMAPEVLRNEPSNEKCDIYSFGVILWELATMRMPWCGMNPMQVVGAVGFQNRRLDIPREVDPMVAQIITDCWDSDPSQRPSFAQLMSPLKQLQRLIVPTS